MPQPNDKLTIISMAVIASAMATLLHEGLGHGVTAWLRGDVVTELTSNHLSSVTPDKVVDAGGTIINLLFGCLALLSVRSFTGNPNFRYFLWLFGALNLLPGAGYFLFSGIFGIGDWNDVIRGWPHQAAWRLALVCLGALLYVLAVRWTALLLAPFVRERSVYNTVGRLPYYAAGTFSCLAGAFDPLGIKMMLLSTIPAAFGGSSGLMWADSFLPADKSTTQPLVVHRAPAWWVTAVLIGAGYVVVLGRGVHFVHGLNPALAATLRR